LQLATSKDLAKRDGKRAVLLAMQACMLTDFRNPEYISTLAAAWPVLKRRSLAGFNAPIDNDARIAD
jgi:hypothetical protein